MRGASREKIFHPLSYTLGGVAASFGFWLMGGGWMSVWLHWVTMDAE